MGNLRLRWRHGKSWSRWLFNSLLSILAVVIKARPSRILLAEQQVLSARSADSNTATSAASCRTRTNKLRGGPLFRQRLSARWVVGVVHAAPVFLAQDRLVLPAITVSGFDRQR